MFFLNYTRLYIEHKDERKHETVNPNSDMLKRKKKEKQAKGLKLRGKCIMQVFLGV